MIVRLVLPLLLLLILNACLADGASDARTATPPLTALPSRTPTTAPTTGPRGPTPTETVLAKPTALMTATGTAEAPGSTPSVDVCLHSHPAFWPRIYIMDADGTNVRPVAPEGVMDAWDPSWSPDGSQIVFGGYDGQDDGIFIMDRDGTSVRRLSDGEGDGTEPAWAPNGTRIVFVRQHPDPGGTHLYIVDHDGHNLQQLTNFAGFVGSPAWSPDGTRIVFSSDLDGNHEIYVMDANGANLTRLTNRPALDGGPIWSPDGQRIMFSSIPYATQAAGASEFGVFVMNIDGTGLRRVEALEPDDGEARWSPDGSRIAFVHDGEIILIDSDGGHRRNLTQHPLTDRGPRWSPDGSEILFVSDRDFLPLAGPGSGRPQPIILRAGVDEQRGGSGTYCEPIENGFRGHDVLGVRLPAEPLRAQAGVAVEFDFSAFPDLTAFEITVYDSDEAQRINKLSEGVMIPPCAPPGGTESICLEQRVTGPPGTSMATYALDLPPGHYAAIVRANFGSGIRLGYTEQGFNLIVE